MADNLEVRTGVIGEQTIRMGVEYTQPICVSDDGIVSGLILRTETGSKTTTISLRDNNNPDRYVFLSNVKSPLTGGQLMLWYDKQFEDILITPPMSFFSLGNRRDGFDLRVVRLGGKGPHLDLSLNNKYPVEETTRVKLPEPKGPVAVKAHLLLLPATVHEGLYNHDVGHFEEQVGAINIIHKVKKMMVLLELGTSSDIFKTEADLFPSLFYQVSLGEYGMRYLGHVMPKTKLYLPLQF